MTIKMTYLPFVFAAILAIGIFASGELGLWDESETKEPAKFTSGTFEGMPNPEDIRGSFSFGDIEAAFGVEASLIAEAFGIATEAPALIKAKDLEGFYPNLDEGVEIGTGAIKAFVSIYTELPYVGEDGIPSTAVDVLKREGKWNEAYEELYSGMIIDLQNVEASTSANSVEEVEKSVPAEEEHETPVGEIKGKTTVEDLIDWGLTLEEIEAVLGIEVPNTNMVIRDLCTANGLEFGEIKVEFGDLMKE